MTKNNSFVARLFLSLNAAFSIVTGLGFLLFSQKATIIMFAEPQNWQLIVLRILGFGLLVFAVDLILVSRNQRISKFAVMLIVLADVGWLVGSAVLVFAFKAYFTKSGILIVDVVAVFVAIFALGQYLGSRRIIPEAGEASVKKKGGVLVFSLTRPVSASIETVWTVMTDHPGYADVANNLSKVEVVSGDQLGMVRRCYGSKGESWTETCEKYEESSMYRFKVHTDAAGYPYPFAELSGEWSVEALGENYSEFRIEIQAKPKGNFIARTIIRCFAGPKFKAVLLDLGDAWAERMESL